MSIEPIDHTADIGADLEAGSLEALYERAAIAFCDAIVEVDTVRPTWERRLRVQADDRELLMVEWLEELLFLFDTEDYLTSRARVILNTLDTGKLELRATVRGEAYARDRHPVKVAIKGVTYHGLSVRQIQAAAGERWRARVIFDI